MVSFRDQLRNAIARRGELTLLHSQQTYQSYPAPWVLADLVLRDAVLGVSRGLPGFHPAQNLPERISLHLAVEGAPDSGQDLADDPAIWAMLCRIWVAGDAPAVQELDANEVLVGLNRVVYFGELPITLAAELGNRFGIQESRLSRAGASSLVVEDGEILVAPVARLGVEDGPAEPDGRSVLGVSGCPVRLRVEAGKPSITLILGFPWGRLPLGVAGGRGVLLEDVRGLQGVQDFLRLNPVAEAVGVVLRRMDAGAGAQGEEEVGFRERVSSVWDNQPLGPSDLLDAVTDVLPNLAIQYADAIQQHDEVLAMVLEQGIVDLIGRQKGRPAMIRGLVELALQKGLAPHVDMKTGDVFWLPLGQFPESLPPEAHESRVLPSLVQG